MSVEHNDLEDLRAEHARLGSRITRLSIILIGVLAVVTFTITNALEKVELRESRTKLDLAKSAEVWARDAYETHRFDSQPLSSSPNPEIQTSPEAHLLDRWDKAQVELEKAQRAYDSLLKDSLSISPAILGSGVRIDLQSWIYNIPIIALASLLYIQLLRKKQKILSRAAGSQISRSTNARHLDRLTFSEKPGAETRYSSTPFQLELILYLLIVLFLLSLIVIALDDADSVLLGMSLREWIQYLLMFFTLSFYGVSYYFYVSESLDKEVAAVSGTAVMPRLALKSLRKLSALTRTLDSRLKPKPSLVTGSLLILASLFLATGASCNGTSQVVRLPGYRLLQPPGGWHWRTAQVEPAVEAMEKLLKDPKYSPELAERTLESVKEKVSKDPGGAWWVSNVMQPKQLGLYWQSSVHNIGRHAYALSLVLAVLTVLVVVFSSGRYEVSATKPVYTFLFHLSTTLSLIIITDFAFNAFWLKDELFLLSNLVWIIPSVLLFSVSFSKGDKTLMFSARKRFLVSLLLPLVVSATVYVCWVAAYGFIGLVLYFIGMGLLSVTYAKLWHRDMIQSNIQKSS